MNRCGLDTLANVADLLGADSSVAYDIDIESITTDTRRATHGALFIALIGERFDAHDYIAEARQAGACAAIVSRRVDDPLPQVVVPDTRLALGLLGQARRQAWPGRLVAVTGNSGKTTVKEMLAGLLRRQGETLATRGNLNNDIGAPLTLLELTPEHRHAVIELGANHLGEIAWTTALAIPDVVVITNVTGAHVGEFGGMGNIAQAKAEILGGLPESGKAILNRDDRYYAVWRCLAGEHDVIDFGLSPLARMTARELVVDASGRYAFTLVFDGQALGRVSLALLGRHNVLNALAAAAAAVAMGLDVSEMVEGLCALQPLSGRMTASTGIRATRLLDDTYNANPGAMRAAIEVLGELPAPRWCLLGAMGELGEESERLHAEVGTYAGSKGIDVLLTVGEAAQAATASFGGAGRHFEDWEAMARYAREHLPTGASVLVKGSRSAGMERVVAALRDDASR